MVSIKLELFQLREQELCALSFAYREPVEVKHGLHRTGENKSWKLTCQERKTQGDY